MTLQENYIALAKQYEKEFAKITDKRGYWDNDYDVWLTEYEGWSYTDMRYIVDNYKNLVDRYSLLDERDRKKLLCREIEEWIEYNVDVANFGIKYINLKSWLSGAPRMSQKQIEELKDMYCKLHEAIGNHQETFGKLDTNTQPKHLRKLKKEF